ncbi:MAG: hypothetical protein AAGF84_07310 [Planctomycetota bacterium]
MARWLTQICIMILVTGVAGCSSTVDEAQLRKSATVVQGDTLGLVEYLGRRGAFDYFRLQYNMGSQRVKLPVPNSIAVEPHPLGQKHFVVGPHAIDRWLP